MLSSCFILRYLTTFLHWLFLLLPYATRLIYSELEVATHGGLHAGSEVVFHTCSLRLICGLYCKVTGVAVYCLCS